MTGKLYIDGQDAYTAYGAFVTQGGYTDLVAYPPLKKVEYNDWHEEDGIEPDLSAPELDTREFDMTFAFRNRAGFEDFMALLSDLSYHTFAFNEIGRTRRLRLVSQPSLTTTRDLQLVTLSFADDDPLRDYTYVAPISALSPCDDYELDDRKFTDYGVRVLAGSLAEVEKAPAVKPNLLRNIRTLPGALYAEGPVTFQTKEVALNCLMRAGTLDELWRNYDALLYDLTRPGQRRLYVKATSEEYGCYYQSNAIQTFHASGKIWLEFTLTLTFLSFRIGQAEYLLATEDDALIITENGYAIDLNIN